MKPMYETEHPRMWQMLFVLGHVLHESSRQFSGKALQVYVSKADFIDIIRKIDAVAKQGRAIYKNLEMLEKQGLIEYKKEKTKKNLGLTKKGYNNFSRMKNNYNECSEIIKKISSSNGLLKTNRKMQTVLKI